MRFKNDGVSSLSHTKWDCQYHIVFETNEREIDIEMNVIKLD